MFQFFFPFADIGEPCFGSFIAEGFFHGSECDIVGEIFAAFGTDGVQVISLVFHFGLYVLLRNVCAQSYGFFSVLHGVVYGPVRSPATYQAFVVGLRYRAFDVYYTGTEDFVFQRFFKEGFHKHIAVSAVEGVAVRHA